MSTVKNFISKYYIYIFIFLNIYVLSHLFIYTGDDWFWASNRSLKLLREGFKYYNGRYISNVISIIISRNSEIKCLLYGTCASLLFFILKKLINEKNNKIPYIAYILFFFIDYKILMQGFIWASGFVNYFIPPIFMLYTIYISNNDKLENLNPIVSVIVGIIFSQFLENIAFMLIAFNIFLIIHSLIKKKKKYNLYFFIGNIIGTAAMFYNMIFYPMEASFRKISFNHIITNFSYKIVSDYYGKSLPIVIILTISIIAIIIIYRKKINVKTIIIYLIIATIYLLTNIYNIIIPIDKNLCSFILILYTIFSFIVHIRFLMERNDIV